MSNGPLSGTDGTLCSTAAPTGEASGESTKGSGTWKGSAVKDIKAMPYWLDATSVAADQPVTKVDGKSGCSHTTGCM